MIDKFTSEVDFDGLLIAAVGVGSAAMQDDEEVGSNGDSDDEDESDDGHSLPSASASASAATLIVRAAKLKYRELLAKARGYPGGEKRLKQAIIQHASDRMEEYLHDGATDNRRVKAIKESHAELTQYVSSLDSFAS